MSNTKKYNIFIFLTTFAKALVELFIPMLLITKGFEVSEIILFFIIVFLLNILISPIVSKLGEKISYKWVIFISAFLFSAMYYYIATNFKFILYIITFLYSLNNSFYYLGKHNYANSALAKNEMGKGVGLFIIITIIATVPSAYIGAKLIKYFSSLTVTIIVLLIYLLGVIPIFMIKYRNHEHQSLKEIIMTIPKQNILYFCLTQFKVLFATFFPLYIFLNIKNNFSYLGILNAIVGITSIVFIYFYAKKMDRTKKDYMLFSALFLGLIYFLELNITSSFILMLVSVVDGIATRLYETSCTKNFYNVQNNQDKSCYFLFNELINNGTKAFILIIIYLFKINLYWSLIIFIIGIFISGFIKYKGK